MSVRIVRLGSEREDDEGLRIGTVRRPPRGVPKRDWAARDIYDVWLPNLAPSEALLKSARARLRATTHARGGRSNEVPCGDEEAGSARGARHVGGVVASRQLLSRCYCADESRCHRSILRALLAERGAAIA